MARRPAIPRTVWALGWVSLWMDVSSELVHSLLPLLLVGGLGASTLMLGLLEGVAEASALLVKIFSGALSDFWGRRKGLLLFGYGLAALSKPLFPLAQSVTTVFVARLLDRFGKGMRGAPRDAMVAEVTAVEIRGAAFGLRQSMDTVGAFLGPLLAVGLMLLFADDIRRVLWLAVIPAAVAVAVIAFAVQEAPGEAKPARAWRSPLHWRQLGAFSRSYWYLMLVAATLTLARFSEAFLLLRAQQLGLADRYVPLVLVLMSLAYTLTAYPAGRLSDRLPRSVLLSASLPVLIAADLLLASAHSLSTLAMGIVLWGLHMGLSQGVVAAMVADYAPKAAKGTAFGCFGLVTGLATLLASVLAGLLWQDLGSAATFGAGALFAGLALALLLAGRQRWLPSPAVSV